MILIIGGAYAGKTEFAKNYFHLSDTEILDSRETSETDILFKSKCIRNYHHLIKKLCEENGSPLILTQQLCQKNPDCIIITDEIGCGIVPIEESERQWREACGTSNCILAAHAETVIRIICGIPTVIKGKLI